MKKSILIVIVVGMFGWAVYDLVSQPNNSSIPDASDRAEKGEDNYVIDQANNETIANEKSDAKSNAVVGLNVGNIAPDFQLQTLKGEQVKLSDYRGKRVLLNFWATWCPPCRAEMPDIEKFHQNKDLVVLAVNLTQTENAINDVQQFVDEFNITFPILLDKGIAVANMYAIRPIPTSFMIDSEGIIRFKAFGALNYDQMIQKFEKIK